jgi:hypothetical protein
MELTQMNSKRFEIVTGFNDGGDLKYQAPIGVGLKSEDEDYYKVSVWSLSPQAFYLVKNQSTPGNYTLYSRRQIVGTEELFLNPVGYGSISDEMKTHLEIRLRFPKGVVYMSLFPKP